MYGNEVKSPILFSTQILPWAVCICNELKHTVFKLQTNFNNNFYLLIVIYDFDGDTSKFMNRYVLFDKIADLRDKYEIKKMVQKWNFLLCLPCWNVFLTWLCLLHSYIIVKSIFLALLSYHLLWYLFISRVRNQQNIKKVPKITMNFSILSMWLADSELI